jgi:antitoxin component HigA of HigAB toxin-antitoxin module
MCRTVLRDSETATTLRRYAVRATEWRVEVKLKPGGRELLRSHMEVRGLSNEDLAKQCGDVRWRSSISHLRSGARDGCSEKLAKALNKVLLGEAAKKSSLFVPEVYRVTQDGATTTTRGRAA